ncbi:hypothetical protein RIF29_32635 [Crotalaria pallida]|uniref:Uncharacterized protein n=1 Tax=Crotalaria pallida TaxID=3830 RepID=A0AAN9ENL5_CROPI
MEPVFPVLLVSESDHKDKIPLHSDKYEFKSKQQNQIYRVTRQVMGKKAFLPIPSFASLFAYSSLQPNNITISNQNTTRRKINWKQKRIEGCGTMTKLLKVQPN